MTELKTAAQIICEVMHDVQAVGKNDRNTAQGFNFRGIDAVMNAVGPALRKAGGFIVPQVEQTTTTNVPSKNGGSLNVVRLEVAYSVYGQTGEPIIGLVSAEAFDSGDKATAKAMSVAYRTFLLQLLCLPTDEPDPDTYSYEIEAPAATDWNALMDALTTQDDARALWGKARDAKASKAILTAIEAKAAAL